MSSLSFQNKRFFFQDSFSDENPPDKKAEVVKFSDIMQKWSVYTLAEQCEDQTILRWSPKMIQELDTLSRGLNIGF